MLLISAGGGGVDETTTDAIQAKVRLYQVKTLPAATFGKIYLTDGTTEVNARSDLVSCPVARFEV